jgi:hypothetical protein
LKNDGKKFIEMMEQLAERRMKREQQAQSSPNSHVPYNGHDHPPNPDDDEYDEEEDDYEDEDEEYDDDEENTAR